MKWTGWIATCGGIGYFPYFPGTIGSLAGLILFLPLRHLPTLHYVLLLILLFGIGVYTSTRSEPYFQKKDASAIVIDELHAMLLILFFLPPVFLWWIAGFVVFRIFDISKPCPIRRFEKLPGGWGIMMDDFIAALYALGLLHLFNGVLHWGADKIG